MIILKTLLLAIIFTICTSIGFLYSKLFCNRLGNLIYLEQCVKMLETEIVYGATVLPEALENIYVKGNPKVGFIFKEIKEDLIENKREDVYLSFLSVKELLYDKLHLKKTDVETFMSLGRVVGTSSRKDQEKNFILILNQISGLILDAREERDKNEKLYRTLGVVTGIGIIIILV